MVTCFYFVTSFKSGLTNELKSIFLSKTKKCQGYLLKKRQNFAIGKTLVWSEYVRSAAIAIFLRVKYELGIHFNQIHLI